MTNDRDRGALATALLGPSGMFTAGALAGAAAAMMARPQLRAALVDRVQVLVDELHALLARLRTPTGTDDGGSASDTGRTSHPAFPE